ncbi:TIGR03085 family metal-binding protein [Corynebacterium sp. 335C]
MSFTDTERAALADLLHRVGPDHPTLCGDWTTRDLAVHLVVRENRPDAAAGMFVGALGSHLEKVSAEYEAMDYDELVDKWAAGAPKWSPFGFGDKWLNAAENFVHHEDVRRAGEGWDVRPMSPGGVRALWKVLELLGPRMLKKSRATVVLQRPDGVAITPVDRGYEGAPVVTVRGDAGELVLWLYGRDVAKVEIDGDAAAVERLSL